MTDGIAHRCSETYCSACETWTPSDDWSDIFEFDDDDVCMVDAIECPKCGYWHPPYDPPTREIED